MFNKVFRKFGNYLKGPIESVKKAGGAIKAVWENRSSVLWENWNTEKWEDA